MTRSKLAQEETMVHKVFDALTSADDFMDKGALRVATGLPWKNIQESLRHLKSYTAVGAMEVEGRLWWLATPESDTRTKTFDLMAPKDGPKRSHFTKASGRAKPAEKAENFDGLVLRKSSPLASGQPDPAVKANLDKAFADLETTRALLGRGKSNGDAK